MEDTHNMKDLEVGLALSGLNAPSYSPPNVTMTLINSSDMPPFRENNSPCRAHTVKGSLLENLSTLGRLLALLTTTLRDMPVEKLVSFSMLLGLGLALPVC